MSEKKEKLENNSLRRVLVECQLREEGFVMSSHHCHSFFEIYYVDRGNCRFLVENNIYDLRQGDFLLIPPDVLHYTRYLDGPCKKYGIYFRSDDISPQVSAAMPGGSSFFHETRIFQLPDAHHYQAELLLDRMLTEEKIEDSRTEAMLYLQLQELLLFCSRNCSFLQEIPANIRTTDRQIVLAARYISDHYMEPISAADIASAAGFSPNYLSKRFREAAGIGVHEYLMFVRLQHAALDLVSTNDSITENAPRSGFSDSNYFKDAFKKKYGTTPSAYRKTR